MFRFDEFSLRSSVELELQSTYRMSDSMARDSVP